MTNSVFKITTYPNETLENYKTNAIRKLYEFFGINWIKNTSRIIIVDNRKTIDLLREEKTPDWLVGWSSGREAIIS